MLPCRVDGCPFLTNRGICERHRQKLQRANDRRRGSATKRGYDREWREAAKAYLEEHPVCEGCHRKPSRVVDHIVPLEHGGARMDPKNWQAQCWSCHEKKKARERRSKAG